MKYPAGAPIIGQRERQEHSTHSTELGLSITRMKGAKQDVTKALEKNNGQFQNFPSIMNRSPATS